MSTTRSSIELVDRHDRESVGGDDISTGGGSRRGGSSRFYNKLRRGKNNKDDKSDLFLTIENGNNRNNRGGDDDDRSVSSISSYLSATSRDGIMKITGTSAEDYTGLELDNMIRIQRRRYCFKVLVLLMIGLSLLIGISMHLKNKRSSSSSSYQNSNNGPILDGPSINHALDDDGFDDDGVEYHGGEVEAGPFSDDDEVVETLSMWPTKAPIPPFDICAPPTTTTAENNHQLPIVHIGDLIIVPEAEDKNITADDDAGWTTSWEYSFSDMDIDEKASIIAIGMNDFSGPPNSDLDEPFAVGLVRAFGWSCKSHTWNQLGQDLLGNYDGEMFGSHVSSSKDGKVMAISAPQVDFDDGQGFVEVYYLDDDTYTWTLLGNRIENLEGDGSFSYSSLGHAMDLSDRGETLAVVAIVNVEDNHDEDEYVIRVFDYDTNKLDWVRKGHDLQVTLNYAANMDYYPHLSLSSEGDKLTLLDPEQGFITYHFEFETDTWSRKDTKGVRWNKGTSTNEEDEDNWWIEHTDMDETGTLIGFSAFQESGGGDLLKIVDFSNQSSPVRVYQNSFADYSVSTDLAISNDGQVAAIVASRWDEDDSMWLSGMEDYVGSLVVVAKNSTSNSWYELGKGTSVENLGVSGDFVAISGDGGIVAVGSDFVITLYGISTTIGGTDHDIVEPPATSSSSTLPPLEKTTFPLCKPFADGEHNSHVGDLDYGIPKQPKQHTISIAMSDDGSVVAVGIDSYFEGTKEVDEENANTFGLVRVFGWPCTADDDKNETTTTYLQLGQDLVGTEAFDGFGQSVDLSSDGKTLVVGANQPPPGKTGYVQVYTYDDDHDEWKVHGERLTVDSTTTTNVHDIGRQVRISDDGTTVLFSGGIAEEEEEEYDDVDYVCDYVASFVRVMEWENDGWKRKGQDVDGSISYDEYGTESHVSLAGDGNSFGVTGSYSNFTAKIYNWNDDNTGWNETIVPPFKSTKTKMDEWDEDYSEYFDGSDISLSEDGSIFAVSGMKWDESEPAVRVMSRGDHGQFKLSHDPIDYTDDEYTPNSVAISTPSGTGNITLVAGLSSHTADEYEQGALYISSTDSNDHQWDPLGTVDGRHERDLLGSRVDISKDGTLAAASSRRGYIRFFKI